MSETKHEDLFSLRQLNKIGDELTIAAVGNLSSIAKKPSPEQVRRIVDSGLVERFESEAAERFTLLHATNKLEALSIMKNGYKFTAGRGDALGIRDKFVEMVPADFPYAQLINTAALSYRHMRDPAIPTDAKIVAQLPVPFPEIAYTDANLTHISRLGLTYFTDELLESGVLDIYHDQSVLPPRDLALLPIRHITGWIDMDSAEFHPRTDNGDVQKFAGNLALRR